MKKYTQHVSLKSWSTFLGENTKKPTVNKFYEHSSLNFYV